MRAVIISKPGGPEVLELREVPDPAVGPGDLLVRIHATAVNRADLLQRRGRYPAPPGAPANIPGLELAGEVEECGASAVEHRRGDRVMAIVGGGAYAERIALPSPICMAIPDGMSWEAAGALPEAFLTAWDALRALCSLSSGETVLVGAAGSGVGTAAVQIGAALGARVIALSRTAQKRARLSELGASAVFDPAEPELPARIRELTGGTGVNVVLDLVGASAWPLYVEVLAERGRIVVVGTLSGSRLALDLGTLMRRRATVIGTVLRGRSLAEKAALCSAFIRWASPLFASGRLRPVVDRVLPLARAADAHRILEENGSFGKVVLRVE